MVVRRQLAVRIDVADAPRLQPVGIPMQVQYLGPAMRKVQPFRGLRVDDLALACYLVLVDRHATLGVEHATFLGSDGLARARRVPDPRVLGVAAALVFEAALQHEDFLSLRERLSRKRRTGVQLEERGLAALYRMVDALQHLDEDTGVRSRLPGYLVG